MNRLLVILGPTSTGKTDLALQFAYKFAGELVSVDSRQVYTGLDIGTGKLPDQLKIENSKLKIEKGNGWWQVNGRKIWMYDVVSPIKQYTVYDYINDASKVIKEIFKRKKLPIIVGGTGFYLKALLEGLPNLAIPIDKKLRKELNNLTIKQLQQKLQQASPDKWNNLNESDRQNPRRLIRAIEIVTNSKLPPASLREALRAGKSQKYNVLKIGLTAPREILYQKSDKRVISRIDEGMVEEAENLYRIGLPLKRMKQLGLEYGVLAEFLEGNIKTKEDLINIMQGKIHGYTRRQLTWFKNEKNINWFDIADKNFLIKVENLIIKWYDNLANPK